MYWHQIDPTVVVNWLLGHSMWFRFYSNRRGTFDEAVGTPIDSHRSGRWQKQLGLRVETVFIYASVSSDLCSFGPVAFRFKHNHPNWSFSSHFAITCMWNKQYTHVDSHIVVPNQLFLGRTFRSGTHNITTVSAFCCFAVPTFGKFSSLQAGFQTVTIRIAVCRVWHNSGTDVLRDCGSPSRKMCWVKSCKIILWSVSNMEHDMWLWNSFNDVSFSTQWQLFSVVGCGLQ